MELHFPDHDKIQFHSLCDAVRWEAQENMILRFFLTCARSRRAGEAYHKRRACGAAEVVPGAEFVITATSGYRPPAAQEAGKAPVPAPTPEEGKEIASDGTRVRMPPSGAKSK